tara:strand:- start:300 stop:1643 length:1344 start_codon:yes stop_codon:yes gene_type:complete
MGMSCTSSGHTSILHSTEIDCVTGYPFLDKLLPSLNQEINWGIARMENFLRDTGDPHLSYSIIHLGGTNGKGSVASIVSSVLNLGGTSTGLYTSPHLRSFNERFQVNGHLVGEDELQELVRDLEDDIIHHELTFFEATTALAFHLFARRGIEVAVIEVGMGGRLDATNVVSPCITAITNISDDHSEYLGDTLFEIAQEKAGIIKPGVPLLTGERDKQLLSIFENVCDDLDAPFLPIYIDPEKMDINIEENKTSFTFSTKSFGNLKFCIPLMGEHQAINTAFSLAILERLPESLCPDTETVIDGVKRACWPGRSQIIKLNGQTWLFDVAHNLAGAQALASVLDRIVLPRPVVMVTAVLRDKDHHSILEPLLNRIDHAIFTQAPSSPLERRWDPDTASVKMGGSDIEVYPDFVQALERAKNLARSGTILVTGSNHTVGDAFEVLDLSPY